MPLKKSSKRHIALKGYFVHTRSERANTADCTFVNIKKKFLNTKESDIKTP